MTEREVILLFLGAAIAAVAVALHRQGALRTPGLMIALSATAAVLSFLILTYS